MKRFGEGRGVNPFGFVMDWWRRHLHMITLMQGMIKSILMLCLALVDSLLVTDDCGLMLVSSSVAALALARRLAVCSGCCGGLRREFTRFHITLDMKKKFDVRSSEIRNITSNSRLSISNHLLLQPADEQ